MSRLDFLQSLISDVANEQENMFQDIGELAHEVSTIGDYEASALETMTEADDELNEHEVISSYTSGASNLIDGGQDVVDGGDEEVEGGGSLVESIPWVGPIIHGVFETVNKVPRGLFDGAVGVAKITMGTLQVTRSTEKLLNPPDYGASTVMKNIKRLKVEDTALYADLKNDAYLRSKIVANLATLHHAEVLDNKNGPIPGPVMVISVLHPTIQDLARSLQISREEAFIRIAQFRYVDGIRYTIRIPGASSDNFTLDMKVFFKEGSQWATGIDYVSVDLVGYGGVSFGAPRVVRGETTVTRVPYTQSLAFASASLQSLVNHLKVTVIPLLREGVTKQNVFALCFGYLTVDASIPIYNHYYNVQANTKRSATTLREYFKGLRNLDSTPYAYGRHPYNLTNPEVVAFHGAAGSLLGPRTPLMDGINAYYGTSFSSSSTPGVAHDVIYNAAVATHDNPVAQSDYDAKLI
jgi:hypothetical protein